MQLSLPKFQYRFVSSMGNVIHPGNFHPVGTQRGAEAMVDKVLERGAVDPGTGGNWLLVGGSGGFGSAARVVLGAGRGANTVSVSLDAQPNPDSSNKIRKLGSPGFHRNLAIDRRLRGLGLVSRSVDGNAFEPETRAVAVEVIREQLGGKIDGIIWALAAPRGLDPRTGIQVSSALRPLGRPVTVKTFTGRDERSGTGPTIAEIEIPPGTPEEAIATQFVMGGRIVEQWVEALLAADVVAEGARLLTISYRGNPLNAGIYRNGLIGLAKADLEFHTRALNSILSDRLGGQAVAVAGPAVVTEASGGIPGVPLYMALIADVLGDQFETPLTSMTRMFDEHFQDAGPRLDEDGLLRMDDRELGGEIQEEMARRFDRYRVGMPFDGPLYDQFMSSYAQTRGFDIEGVDYDAEFDTEAVCA